MSTVTHDIEHRSPAQSRVATGALLALGACVAFGMSGSLASALFDTGWSPGATALIRSAIGMVVALPFGLRALAGRWSLLRDNAALLVVYGLFAVSGAQFCYFMAVERMAVGPALLIEYTAPAAVVLWLWARHGQRPSPVTVVGATVAAVGLVCVLDLTGDSNLSMSGVGWALMAMVGAATYFLVNGDEENTLPPMTLAAGGLAVGTAVLALLALGGVLPMSASTADVTLRGAALPWWVPVIALGVVTSGVAYLVGVAGGRILGARVASFISLFEVVAGVGFAWLFVAQVPSAMQALGGLLILAGVIAVKLGETTRQPANNPLEN